MSWDSWCRLLGLRNAFRSLGTEEVCTAFLRFWDWARKRQGASLRCIRALLAPDPPISSLLISNAHHIVAQQYLLMSNLVEERSCNVARVHDTLGMPFVI
jgi:hypothetical protein